MNLRYAIMGIISLAVSTQSVLAQDVEKDDNKAGKSMVSKPSRDFLMLQFTYSGWLNAPDSIKTKGFGRGFNGYVCYDFPIKKSHFSFAAGIGVGVDNIYLNGQEVVLTDNDSNAQARFVPETINYKRYKVTTTYLEAPFELRFFGNKENRNSGFKAALGLRVGTLMGAHTKGKEDGTKIIYQVNSKRYLETWRFAGTVRLGYGNFTLLGTYNLTNLYKDLLGPPLTPFSIGLCVTGL
ncbi:MAG: outer membrane beta-barrel protein [Chitinophagales bacterium]|nr:outer membrane beta-barrel protein [Chitinophagales bacterium]